MNKRFLIIMVVIVAVFAGLIFLNKSGQENENGGQAAEPTSHTFGETDSNVTVLEYGDFECPACGSYFPIFTQLKTEYADRVTFQFRHFPLVANHKNAMAAHRAAEAASNQGKFWEMHDLLYSRQQSWQGGSNAAETFSGYAEELELDMEQYAVDVDSGEVNAKIQADMRAGQDVGVTGTPTFLINGEVIESPRSIEDFRALIDEALGEQTE